MKGVNEVRGLLSRYPADVSARDSATRSDAARLLEEVMESIGFVAGSASALEALEQVTTEGLLLCGATSTAVQLVRDLLATLTAELDSTAARA